ncbi:conserved Plasmodium protein, unknown function [Plasmodium gallinaceum]|uniref:Uncharacterized protein n=1 Tax=Plasmodium gallinaceum TaxID=5849 RepID=A0A1J1GV77_PLAGA|nr:conserved Plasmodium protein, unknown function [Plasmodium gallinaceum]CRG96431.1 conserved Plasmodium protein, unknown function [Plasmodium gallinaceum]
MLIENKIKIKNLIYECNEKLKLYIKIKQNIMKNDMHKSTEELKECYNKCVESNLIKFNEVKCFDDEFISEKKLNTDIINCLLDNYLENNNRCVISFNKYENFNTIKNNLENEEKNDYINYIYLYNLIEHFFVKISVLSAKKNENKIYTLRFGAFNFSNVYDLLEEYDDNEEYNQKKRSYTLKYEKEKNYFNNINVELKSELKNFNEKTKAIEFSDLEKLKDILNFAEKKKKSLEKKLNMNEPFFYTLITIDIIEIKENNLMKIPITNNCNKYILDKYYFLNISYTNYDDEKESVNIEELRKSFYEIINLIKHYLNNNLKIDISNFNRISKIVHEICYDMEKIFLKVVLYFPYNYDNKFDEYILNFLYTIDIKLKDYLNLFNNNLTKVVNDNYNMRDHKDVIISDNEKYHKLDKILFNNIDLDENLKYNVLIEALNLPEESFNCLTLLNKTFQHNYDLYKEKEKEFYRNILNLVEKQNEIIKSYEEKENKKKDEINSILKEIYYINEKNLEIENEIQRHQNLNMEYLQKEENKDVQNLKRIHTIDNILNKEYEYFLKFRNESINNQEKPIKKEKNFQSIQDNNISNNILNIQEKQEEEYLKNLNEAMKYAEQNFQQTHNLKKKYDDIICKKMELFKILKSTVIKLNEKTNSLKNNFKSTKGLKFVYPIDDNYISFKEKYKNHLTCNNLKEYNELLEELKKNDFNEKQVEWILKMNSISKKF